MKKNKKVLMVMAHPDDEVIFGWPIFFDENIEKKEKTKALKIASE